MSSMNSSQIWNLLTENLVKATVVLLYNIKILNGEQKVHFQSDRVNVCTNLNNPMRASQESCNTECKHIMSCKWFDHLEQSGVKWNGIRIICRSGISLKTGWYWIEYKPWCSASSEAVAILKWILSTQQKPKEFGQHVHGVYMDV